MFFFLILFVTFFGFDGYAQEIITIEIDGSNLPDDIGTLSKGKEIYLKRNLFNNEMVICMGAGSISGWIREIGNRLK